MPSSRAQCVFVVLWLAVRIFGEVADKTPCPGGFCRPRHVCPQGGPGQSVDPQDSGLIILRLLEDEEDDICLDLMMTCCLTPNDTIPNPSSYGTITIKVENNDIFPNDTCGESNPGGLKYRLESDAPDKAYAQYGEFPWTVILIEDTFYNGQSRYEPIGGASLIHPRFVVTVAHVLQSPLPNRVFARFGEWDFASEGEYWPVEDIDINKNVFIHPNYIARGFKNDIALAKLEQPLVYKTHIRPICLPTTPAVKDQFDGQRCTSNGWGLEMKSKTYASVMKRVDLPILPREKCETMLRASRLGPFFKLHSSVICAGGERDLDMCTGDGGSPLACRTSAGKYELAGIVSWGLSCGDQNVPAGYVDVSQFVGWIHETIAENDVA